MDPIRLFTVIALLSLPTVMFGGYSLLRLMKDRKLTPFQETYFRAGHAHAGVLLILALVSLVLLGGTDYSNGMRWLVCLLLLIGILAQSGGMFLHAFSGPSRTVVERQHPHRHRRRPARRRPDHSRDRSRHNLAASYRSRPRPDWPEMPVGARL